MVSGKRKCRKLCVLPQLISIIQVKFAVLILPVTARKGTTAHMLTMPCRIVTVRILYAVGILFIDSLNNTCDQLVTASAPSEPDLEEEYYDAGPPPVPDIGSPPFHRVDRKKGARPVSITIPPATNFLPPSGTSHSALPTAIPSASGDKRSGKGSGASSATHRRTRSMSIPQTAGSPRSGTVNVSPLLSLVIFDDLIAGCSYFPPNLLGVYESFKPFTNLGQIT